MDKKQKKAKCIIGSLDPTLSNYANIYQINFCLIACGSDPSNLNFEVFGKALNLQVDKDGDLNVNGKTIEGEDIGNGIKMYVFKKQDIIKNQNYEDQVEDDEDDE